MTQADLLAVDILKTIAEDNGVELYSKPGERGYFMSIFQSDVVEAILWEILNRIRIGDPTSQDILDNQGDIAQKLGQFRSVETRMGVWWPHLLKTTELTDSPRVTIGSPLKERLKAMPYTLIIGSYQQIAEFEESPDAWDFAIDRALLDSTVHVIESSNVQEIQRLKDIYEIGNYSNA